MKIFLVGDHRSNTGPANVTKELLKRLPGTTKYLEYRNKLLRLGELFCKMPGCDVCLLSGYSKQNLYAISFAHIFKKPVVYLMHGCVEFENKINHEEDPEMNRTERATIAGCVKTLAVSEQFKDWLCGYYPEYADRFDVLTNGVDWSRLIGADQSGEKALGDCGGEERIFGRILTVGGGMPRKRIPNICRAIGKINEKGGVLHPKTGEKILLSLYNAGLPGEDTDKINSFPFVHDLGQLPFETMQKEMRKSCLFIQNSCFETFGLAPVEALTQGCDILVSSAAGVLSLFNETEPEDVILDCENADEIAGKIEILLQKGNAERLLSQIDKENTSWDSVSIRLQNILRQIAEKRS